MLFEEIVYNNTDNIIALALTRRYIDSTHIAVNQSDIYVQYHEHPAIVRAKFKVKPIIDDPTDVEVIVDSQANAAWFDFTDPEILKARLGLAGIKPGRHRAVLIIYETGSVNGFVWGEIMLEVNA